MGAEPWGQARRSFLCRLRLDLAAVDLTLASGTTVRAGQAALFSCQVGQWSSEVTAVTSALSTENRVRIRCQAILALNAPAVWSVGAAIRSGLLLGEDRASGEPETCSPLGGGSGETEVLRGRLPLSEARLGRGVIESLEWTDP